MRWRNRCAHPVIRRGRLSSLVVLFRRSRLSRQIGRTRSMLTPCSTISWSMDINTFFKTYADPDAEMQKPFDAAVIVVTILRPELRDALRSVFAQDLQGRVQCLIGIDGHNGDLSLLD